jgi:hypothetical protein
MRSTYKILAGNLQGNGPLGRPRHRWKNKIKKKECKLDVTDSESS